MSRTHLLAATGLALAILVLVPVWGRGSAGGEAAALSGPKSVIPSHASTDLRLEGELRALRDENRALRARIAQLEARESASRVPAVVTPARVDDHVAATTDPGLTDERIEELEREARSVAFSVMRGTHARSLEQLDAKVAEYTETLQLIAGQPEALRVALRALYDERLEHFELNVDLPQDEKPNATDVHHERMERHFDDVAEFLYDDQLDAYVEFNGGWPPE